ncbi:uncharacterized protein DUF4838 [Chitinophaga skermanii]|uniref:Uncharacterized protein DUF4838 n=1 Tax=Chitinophaga skermanii TaxID=331697 RepID=A0A327QXM8_9BACT|nr:DUF4838 domain-containing protein [Chitinophaga skermanii]RAJ08484.1 uncharacterized protein DUF4838 [Chitinophaga skermanii]
MSRIFVCLLSFIVMHTTSFAQQIALVENHQSQYNIVLPPKASKEQTKAAFILQDYIYRGTGAQIPVLEKSTNNKNILILSGDQFQDGAYAIDANAQQLQFSAAAKGKGIIYSVYAFIEEVMKARKYDQAQAFVPATANLTVPANYHVQASPRFIYRETYFPATWDEEYRDWHKLQQFEALWGLWGHSFYKLVPPRQYFKAHPEYFSLVNGERKPEQLCLSNEAVLQIAIQYLDSAMRTNPEAVYWSISANDGLGFCECDLCRKVDDAEGGPTGSLIHFVNKIAARFPTKQFTTLAYLYTARAPQHVKPVDNVHIMLSTINAFRSKNIAEDPSAASFRADLQAWKDKTSHLMVWDYCTQFTNYLTPFMNAQLIAQNLQYFETQGISGVFEQGSGYTYSDMAALKSYVSAKTLWAPTVDPLTWERDFLDNYYGRAAQYIRTYLQLLTDAIKAAQTRLDIYGNPVNDHNRYLSPVHMDAFSTALDKAEAAVEGDTLRMRRVAEVRLSQEYVYLQQARFYHHRANGIFEQVKGTWQVKANFPRRVDHFLKVAKNAGVQELSEGGIHLDAYEKEWQQIFAAGVRTNLAAKGTVKLKYPFEASYPANGLQTLIDETPGYNDFSYNWQLVYDHPLEATIDIGKVMKVQRIQTRFLQDARHWIFAPHFTKIEVSRDGQTYTTIDTVSTPEPLEDYDISFLKIAAEVQQEIRYIKLTAIPLDQLPAWRFTRNRKVMTACDEVWVE